MVDRRVTQVGVSVEYEVPQETRATAVAAMVEYQMPPLVDRRMTSIAAMVEYTEAEVRIPRPPGYGMPSMIF